MPAGEIRLGDIGTKFLVTLKDQDDVVVDVSGATTLQIIFQKPDESTDTQTASLENTGVDGQINYVTLVGDLDIVGKWRYQGYVVIGVNSWKSSIGDFKVHRNL